MNATRESFDLAVVGGGSAGFAAAIKGADLGARVALIEGATLGGTCVNVGCIPSKTLIRAAEAHHRRVNHTFHGIPTGDGPPRWGEIRQQKDELVSEMRQGKYWNVLRAHPAVTLFEQRAVLTPGGIRLSDGRGVTAGKVVLTTGASSWAPPIEGLAGAGYLDYVSAMALDRLPDSLVVVGAGGVGLELGQMFARLGLEVTILEGLPRVAPTEDPAVGAALAEYLRQEGLDVHVEVRVDRVDRRPGGYIVTFSRDGTTCLARGERLLMATGRRPNTGGLGLAPMGVTLGTKGEVVVDRFLQTGNPDIYAAGDVTGDPMFVYVAAYGGSVAAENALTSNRQVYDLSPLPRVTFTDPAVASVGLTEEEARARGVEVLVSQLPLEHVPRSVAARDTRGFVKLVADASTRRIVGAHILAAEAGEMITEAVTAIRFGLTIEDIVSMFHPYLTLSEGIKLAAQGFTRDLANLSCCAA